jgi:peptidoglycan/LPS O-acetylase OafA/YrhL
MKLRLEVRVMVKQGFRVDINALRAFAVIGVIGYHFGIPGFGGGFAGVDVFFVISGYLITLQIQLGLESNRLSFSAFYISRLRRIFPALAFMCFAIMLFGWWFVFPNDYVQHAKSAYQALYFGSNLGFIKAGESLGYFESVKTALSPFLHTWSLSIEGQFYLIFPLFWVMIYKKLNAHQDKVVLAAFLLVLAYFLYDVQHHTEASFYLLPVRTWEFMLGACLVLLPKAAPKPWVSNAVNLIGITTLLASLHLLSAKSVWPSYLTFYPVFATALILGTSSAVYSNWLFNNWFIQRTGDMSYSLYLWHWPLVVFAKQYVAIYDRSLEIPELVALLVVTYLLAYASWRFIESPVRKNKEFWTGKVILISAFVTAASFWGASRWLDLTEGKPNRFNTQSNQMAFDEMLKPPKYGATCMDDQRTPVNIENIEKCKINTDKSITPSILLWGDSHLHHYYPAFQQVAFDLSINGYFASRGGCHAALPDVYPFDRYAHEYEANFCIEFNKMVYEKYLKLPSIHTVVLAKKWFDGESVDQTIRLVKEISQSGKKIVLIGAIAKPSFNVPERWIQLQKISQLRRSNLTTPREQVAALDNIDNYVKEQLALEISQRKVIWVEAIKYICDAKDCYFVKDGVNNYWDASHLTERKALEFVDEFKRALKN